MLAVLQQADFPIYAVAAAIYLAAFIVLCIRMRSTVTPFHFCLLFFFAESALGAFPMMKIDAFGRTHYEEPLSTTIGILIASAITLGGLALLLRRPYRYTLTDYRLDSRVPRVVLIALLLGVVAASSANSLLKLGTFPLFAMANMDPSDGDAYEYAFSGFITFVGWGAARTLAIWALMELAVTRLGILGALRKHAILFAGAALAMILNVLDGQRNALVLMGLNGLFLGSMRGWFKVRHLVIIMVVGVVYFVAAGSLRRGSGNDITIYLESPTGIAPVDTLVASGITYLEPNIHNLNNLVGLDPSLTFGLQYLTEILPDKIFTVMGATIPESSAELLTEAKMYSQPGLTFRTSYADLYRDFGGVGSVIFVTLLYGAGVWTFNKSTTRPKQLLAFFMVAPAIVFIPFINVLRSIVVIVPLLLFLVLRFHRISGTSSGRPGSLLRRAVRERTETPAATPEEGAPASPTGA